MAPVGRPKKTEVTREELAFARYIGEYDLTPVEAARKAFGWRCEPRSSEYNKARALATHPRIRMIVDHLRLQRTNAAKAEISVQRAHGSDLRSINKFLMDQLKEVRDNPVLTARTRWEAITALEKLQDPSNDRNLIMRWISMSWYFMEAHCPSCHNSFPLASVRNHQVDSFRQQKGLDLMAAPESDLYARRLRFIKLADRRRLPHKSQKPALEARERHVVGLSAAQAGKSFLMSLFAGLGFMIPGVEIWILARVYESGLSEAEYLRTFLRSVFYPHYDDLVKEYADAKNGELVMASRWNSVLKIRSAKSKFSISGRALELALVAEPGWVPDDIFNHLRARITSRLGRIIAFGTPQDTSGFLNRLVNTVGYDERGKIKRWLPEERLLANGCPWESSMLVYNLDPRDNPEYVKSELRAAKMEMSAVEYATEFEGKAVSPQNAKFPHMHPAQLVAVPREFFRDAVFVMGVDQGPSNFGGCLVAYDGNLTVPCYEYFDNSSRSMRANLIELTRQVPRWISVLGGQLPNWKLTITDREPAIWQIMEELKSEGHGWPTPIVERHENKRLNNENWRRELTEFVNNASATGKLLFHLCDYQEPIEEMACTPGAQLVFQQLRDALERNEDPSKESGKDNLGKGWYIRDRIRGDHVPDALFMALWTIYTGQLELATKPLKKYAAFEEASRGLDFLIQASEAQELYLFPTQDSLSQEEIFRKVFGRPRPSSRPFGVGPSNYRDE